MIISLLEVAIMEEHYWISILNFDINDKEYSFLHIERDYYHWKFDFLFLRNLYYWCLDFYRG